MNQGRLIFAQVMDYVHREQLDRCLQAYPMRRASRGLSARDQFLAMAFAQMTFRESLRDIEACLRHSPHLHAMGIRGRVTRTNLAYANEHRDWRIYAALAEVLIGKARRLYAGDPGLADLEEAVYALDSTTIDLCLEMFPWAHFRSTKAAIKLHTLIDLRGSIPVFIRITEGAVHDVNILDELTFEPGAIYAVDRGYMDCQRLYALHQARAYFVTRAKVNLSFTVHQSWAVDKATGLRCDQIISFKGAKAHRDYPERLRRIRYRDPVTGKSLVFLTNHMSLPALTVAAVYKGRWHIELFFKWIKQNLRIKAFYGTSPNAVKTQVWIAICLYLLVAIVKKTHDIPESLGRILQILSVNAFQKEALCELLTNNIRKTNPESDFNQLTLNGF